jgi:hypothetical protein
MQQNDFVSNKRLIKGLTFTTTDTVKENTYKPKPTNETQNPTLMQLSPNDINAISTIDLVNCLDMNTALKTATTPLENSILTLLIDQRQFSDFKEEHLLTSINVSLTPIIRRYLLLA